MRIAERLLSVSTRTKILTFFIALMVSLGVLLLLAVRKTVVPSLHHLYHDKGRVLAGPESELGRAWHIDLGAHFQVRTILLGLPQIGMLIAVCWVLQDEVVALFGDWHLPDCVPEAALVEGPLLVIVVDRRFLTGLIDERWTYIGPDAALGGIL